MGRIVIIKLHIIASIKQYSDYVEKRKKLDIKSVNINKK
jgi:hypothetical protein